MMPATLTAKNLAAATVLWLSAALTPAGSANADQPATFQFRELTSQLTLATAKEQKLVGLCQSRKLNGAPSIGCLGSPKFNGAGVAGEQIKSAFMIFDDQGLTYFSVDLSSSSVAAVAAAFEAKYGEPCANETSKLQNAYGAEYQQLTRTWCFSDGKLKLERYGRRVSESRFIFTPSRAEATSATPQVDF